MKKSGLADNPLFSVPEISEKLSNNPLPGTLSTRKNTEQKPRRKKPKITLPPSDGDIMQPFNHDTAIPRYHDTTIELVRKAVKEFGKEAATHRFTQAEKTILADIIYTYKNQGVKTSENEITRIAVNFLVQDYLENGENSILAIVLIALHE